MDELANVCRQEQVSLLPYSPLGGGVLSGKYNLGEVPLNSRFADYRQSGGTRQRAMADRFLNEATRASTARYLEIAGAAGLAPVTLATAWSMQHDFVASTIIGARTAEQLEDSLAALDVTLDDEVLRQCDAVHTQILYPMG